MMTAQLALLDPPEPVKLDLGCGTRKQAGYIGVDCRDFPGVDKVADLRQIWPWVDNSVDEVYSSHTLEHLPGIERVHFFNELYRVLKVGAKATIITPHWSNSCAYGDPTHQWPPVSEWYVYYLNKGWRDTQAPHVGFTCDFDFIVAFGFDERAMGWNDERRMFAINHSINSARDIHATLTKRP